MVAVSKFWTDERIALALKLKCSQHRSTAQIAEIIGVTAKSVQHVLANHGVAGPLGAPSKMLNQDPIGVDTVAAAEEEQARKAERAHLRDLMRAYHSIGVPRERLGA